MLAFRFIFCYFTETYYKSRCCQTFGEYCIYARWQLSVYLCLYGCSTLCRLCETKLELPLGLDWYMDEL